jgi:hypothetical protein
MGNDARRLTLSGLLWVFTDISGSTGHEDRGHRLSEIVGVVDKRKNRIVVGLRLWGDSPRTLMDLSSPHGLFPLDGRGRSSCPGLDRSINTCILLAIMYINGEAIDASKSRSNVL